MVIKKNIINFLKYIFSGKYIFKNESEFKFFLNKNNHN